MGNNDINKPLNLNNNEKDFSIGLCCQPFRCM